MTRLGLRSKGWRGTIRATALLFFLCLCPAVRAQFTFQFSAPDERWTLRNNRVEAVFRLDEGSFRFERFTLIATKDVWIPAPERRTSPVALVIDGQPFGENTHFSLVSHLAEPIPRQGYRQTIVLDDASRAARVQIELDMYENQPVLRAAVRFRNLGFRSVRITDANMLSLALAGEGRTFQGFRVNQWVSGGYSGNFEPLSARLVPGNEVSAYSGSGAQQCAWLAVRDQSDRGLFAGWEFNGRAVGAVEQSADDGALLLSASVLELGRQVDPQEEFAVPASFIGAFHGDWEEAGYRTQRFVEAALADPVPDPHFPYVAWDSWGYGTNVDEKTLRRNAEIAASLGIELFVVDLGWARQIGEWDADPKKFPSGMRALSDYVHSLGMKFGLHFALAEAAPRAPVLVSNPDWAASVNDGYFGAISLCPAHAPVREWLVDQTQHLIEDYGADWILQDGENMVKRCTKTTHTHDPADSNYSNAVDGLDAIVGEVLRRYPNVHWENCEDGGNMMTFQMARNYVTSIAADNSSVMTTRQAIFGVTYPFPPRYADRYMPAESLDAYTTRSHMFGGPWIFMNRLAAMSTRDLQFAASEIQLYKTLRARVRDGKVFHLTQRPVENRIDALESYHPESGSALIFAFRAGGNAAFRVFRVRGLNRARTYQVHFQSDARRWTATGANLADEGIGVALPAFYSAEIVYIEPVGQVPDLP